MIQIPLVKYDLNNKSFTGKTSVNNANFKSPQAKIQFGHVFSKKHSINFTGETKNTSRLDQALQYIKNVKEYEYGKSLELSDFDPKQMEGILDGIDLFSGMTVYDLYLLEKLNSMACQRGCKNQCSHCMLEAKAPSKTMKWENIEKLANGFGELEKRLGINFASESFMPYLDSDPMALQAADKNGKTHNVAEVQELFYDKTNKPFNIVTAGWDQEQKDCQKAAEDLVNLVKRKPDSLKGMELSFHPFQKWMTKSIKSKDPDEAAKYRKKYMDRMTDVVITLLPIFKLKGNRSQIRLEYMPSVPKDSPMSEESMRKMALELVDNVIDVCKKRNLPKEEYMFFKEQPHVYFRTTCISNKGRAKRLFHTDKELQNKNRIDNSNNKLKLLIDDFVGLDEVIGTLYNQCNYPVINEYIFNINLDKNNDLIKNEGKIKALVEDLIEIRKLFLDHKTLINIQTSNNQEQSEFLSKFKTLLEQSCGPSRADISSSIINSVKFNSIDLSKFDKEINHFTDLYNLVPDSNENKRKFTELIGCLAQQQEKYLDTDGYILLPQKEYAYGAVDKNTYKLKGLKFNFDNDGEPTPNSDPLRELDFDIKSFVISQIPEDTVERDKKYNLTGDDQNIRTISFGRKLERWA